MAVLAVVLALLLPALGRSRESARELAYSTTAGQLVKSIALYAHDFGDHHPYLGVRLEETASEHEPEHTISIRGWRFPLGASFFSQRYFWLSVVCPEYYEAWRDPFADVHPEPGFVERDGVPDFVLQSTFWMTDSAFADAGYFVNSDDRSDPSVLRATRTAEITTPSKKSLLTLVYGQTAERLHGKDKSIFALSDGSSEVRDWFRGEQNRWTVLEPGAFGELDWHTMGTLGGLRGQDW